MPRIGFGTAALGWDTGRVVEQALEVGYRLLDSAQAREWYREDLVGEAVLKWKEDHEEEEDLFLVTKIHPRDFGEQRTKDAVRLSIQIMGNVDLLLIHSPRCWSGMCP